MRELDVCLGTFQAQVFGLYLGFERQRFLKNLVGQGQGGGVAYGDCRRVGAHNGKALGRVEFQQLGERQQGKAVVVVGLRQGEAALGESGLLLRHFHAAGLARAVHLAQAFHLHRVDVNLPLGHVAQLKVVKNLHVCLRHLHAYIVAGLVKVGCGGLEVQLVQLYCARYAESGEQRNGCAQRQRSAACVLV